MTKGVSDTKVYCMWIEIPISLVPFSSKQIEKLFFFFFLDLDHSGALTSDVLQECLNIPVNPYQ